MRRNNNRFHRSQAGTNLAGLPNLVAFWTVHSPLFIGNYRRDTQAACLCDFNGRKQWSARKDPRQWCHVLVEGSMGNGQLYVQAKSWTRPLGPHAFGHSCVL